MSVVTLPFELPARVARRAADDLGAIAHVARELPARLDALDTRAARMQEQFDRALTLAESIDRRGESVVELGSRIAASPLANDDD